MHAEMKIEGAFQPDALLAGDSEDALAKKVVVAAGQVLKRGTVIGKVTASRKYLQALAAAQDGSQTPDMILAMDVDASAGDVEAMAYFAGTFNGRALILGAGLTLDSLFDVLRAKGIYLL